RQLFKNHPYGQQPTIGLPEHIKNPSLRNIGKYYAAHYVPNNMAIFISGDIDAEETIEIIDQHFSAWRPGDLPEPQTWEEPPLAGREYVECSYEGEEYALLAFRTVPRSHPDAEALLVFDMVLDNAMAGLINLNLNQRQRVRQAGAFPGQMNDYGAQYFWGVPKDGQPLEEVEALLLEQIELVKRGEFEDWILAAILNDFKKRVKGGLEDNAARAGMIRESFIAFEEWDHTVAQLDRIEKVTREDVMRVAAAYFSGGYVAGFRKDAPHQPPYYDKPDLAAIDIDPNRESEFGKRIAALPSAAVEPVFVDPVRDYTKTADESGVTLYHVPNRINDLFSFSISVDIGRRQDDRIGVATALLEKAGTDRLDPEALRKEWYRLGTDFAVVAGDDETTVSIAGLDEQFDASLALLVECLTAPISDDATLETLKRNLLKSREDAQKQPDTLMRALFLHHRYGEESPYLRRLPGPAVEALALDELLGLIRGLARYRRTVFYTGSLPLEAVQAALARHCPVKGPLDAPPPYTFLRAKAPERSEIAFVHREMGQAHIRIEFGDVEFDETLTPASQLFNEYFGGGMAGVVFQELREARALAYSAGARYIPGNRLGDQNLMIGGIETQADKTVEAVSTFIDLFDALPPSPERFALAKESLINLYRTGKVGFRQVAGVVRSWERLGLAPDPRAQRYPVILASSLDDLLRFHQQHIGDKPKLISIVGDRAKIDMDRLGALAPVTELTADQLFTP
ncbi:MAG TPA: insulinase family protein, partial [Candidatus Hydrogenedentes bacterium]|nr:insulinase family protein [Candidatus Hydrogenedentota bacterium]